MKIRSRGGFSKKSPSRALPKSTLIHGIYAGKRCGSPNEMWFRELSEKALIGFRDMETTRAYPPRQSYTKKLGTPIYGSRIRVRIGGAVRNPCEEVAPRFSHTKNPEALSNLFYGRRIRVLSGGSRCVQAQPARRQQVEVGSVDRSNLPRVIPSPSTPPARGTFPPAPARALRISRQGQAAPRACRSRRSARPPGSRCGRRSSSSKGGGK